MKAKSSFGALVGAAVLFSAFSAQVSAGATEGLSDHIPEDQRGILGNLDENAARTVRSLLRNKLNR
jgi:hypothetical protein